MNRPLLDTCREICHANWREPRALSALGILRLTCLPGERQRAASHSVVAAQVSPAGLPGETRWADGQLCGDSGECPTKEGYQFRDQMQWEENRSDLGRSNVMLKHRHVSLKKMS